MAYTPSISAEKLAWCPPRGHYYLRSNAVKKNNTEYHLFYHQQIQCNYDALRLNGTEKDTNF